jgi:glucose/arabinose dehydrogenase
MHLPAGAGIAAALCWGLALSSHAAIGASCAAGFLAGPAALQSDWSQDRPGLCRQILPAELPAVSASSVSKSKVVSRAEGALPRVPPGFAVNLVHQGASQLRLLRTAPNGDVFVAASTAGAIQVLRPSGPCTIAARGTFTGGLNLPFGIAFYPPGPSPTYVYVAETNRVVRYPYANGLMAATTPPEVVVPSIPGGAGELPGKGHWTRDVVFAPDGRTMYVSVGSYSNDMEQGEDENGRAAVLAFNPDGSNRRVLAWGLRNPVSLAFSPIDGALWTTVNERDRLGDNLVPDFVTAITPGGFYGWPWYYIGYHPDPVHAASIPAGLPPVTTPNVLLQAHSASLGAAFYTGAYFPAEYHNNLFVAVHGSWNRANPIGSKVIRLSFDARGQMQPFFEDFMTGFVVANHDVWGRPVGIAVGADGTLYVSEDANNTIWCVSYHGAAAP